MNAPSLFTTPVSINAAHSHIEKHLAQSPSYTVSFGMFKKKNGKIDYNGMVVVSGKNGAISTAVVVADSFEGLVTELVEKVTSIKL